MSLEVWMSQMKNKGRRRIGMEKELDCHAKTNWGANNDTKEITKGSNHHTISNCSISHSKTPGIKKPLQHFGFPAGSGTWRRRLALVQPQRL